VRDGRVYLRYIRESIDRVEQYTRDGEADFIADVQTQDAVLRRMETLADAAAHLSDALKARHPAIAWRQVSDFRNVLAHGYTEIRLDQVWHAVTHDLPALAAAVDAELARR
jgi:uncharacterized protein with HEPN domain